MWSHHHCEDIHPAHDCTPRVVAAGEEISRGHTADSQVADGPRAEGVDQRARLPRQHPTTRPHCEIRAGGNQVIFVPTLFFH